MKPRISKRGMRILRNPKLAKAVMRKIINSPLKGITGGKPKINIEEL